MRNARPGEILPWLVTHTRDISFLVFGPLRSSSPPLLYPLPLLSPLALRFSSLPLLLPLCYWINHILQLPLQLHLQLQPIQNFLIISILTCAVVGDILYHV
ncbi:hypothetical protein K440DRAFT_146430 [Wilcoxina mikolae CBS 423.85]|nr:hypothetical protein K440DRAFT_146430 [Wilcoxina mikolae CBS 423.85]